jgi:hypothetical protein
MLEENYKSNAHFSLFAAYGILQNKNDNVILYSCTTLNNTVNLSMKHKLQICTFDTTVAVVSRKEVLYSPNFTINQLRFKRVVINLHLFNLQLFNAQLFNVQIINNDADSILL